MGGNKYGKYLHTTPHCHRRPQLNRRATPAYKARRETEISTGYLYPAKNSTTIKRRAIETEGQTATSDMPTRDPINALPCGALLFTNKSLGLYSDIHG